MCRHVGMSTRHPTDRLTTHECNEVRAIIDAKGKRAAATELGLRDLLALMTAVAGYDVHRLTVATIRARLGEIRARNAA